MRVLSAVFLFLLMPVRAAETPSPATPPVKVIFDTDYTTDCDDPGALAVLHALADLGELEILATGASTGRPKAPGAIDVVNTYYGRPDIPISATKKGPTFQSAFADHLFDHFPHDTPLTDAVEDSVSCYRRILAAQPDDSVVLITVGYLTNVAELLKSQPDAHSPLPGRELVAAKVREWACMGGNFWSDSTDNVNFSRDAASAAYAILHFPKKIMFIPREVASVPSPLRAGEELNQTPITNPVRVAYHRYFGRTTGIDRHCADLATVLYAARGALDYWDIETTGAMTEIFDNGRFTWNPQGTADHQYLKMKGGIGVYSNKEYVEQTLRELLKRPPAAPHSPGP
jgi:inosine-uridine nucleoside N-ribohydrolase